MMTNTKETAAPKLTAAQFRCLLVLRDEGRANVSFFVGPWWGLYSLGLIHDYGKVGAFNGVTITPAGRAALEAHNG